jgi:hypothetical protein
LFKPLPSDHSNHCSDTIQTTTKWPFKPLLMRTFKPLLWYHSNHCSDHYSSIISKWFPIFYHYFLGDVCDYTIQLNTWAVVWMVTGQWFEQYLSSVLHILLNSGLNGIWAVVWILFEQWFEWSPSSGLQVSIFMF